MSVAHLIDEARRIGHYEGSVLVIMDRPACKIRLTLEWDDSTERWRGTCSDESFYFTYSAPCTVQGSDDVVAVAGVLNQFLDASIHGIGGYSRKVDRIDDGNRWAREQIA